MKFKCPLIVVSNISKSKSFYETILNQKVKYDFGENVTFEGDFAIHQKEHFSKMVEIKEENILFNSNNGELYFEEDNFDSFLVELRKHEKIKYIHDLVKHPWGQRVIRFYDPDLHIVEVGESVESVVNRFLLEGYSTEETAKLTQHPIEFVRSCIDKRK